jgi:ABC-2 type transport system permease protein
MQLFGIASGLWTYFFLGRMVEGGTTSAFLPASADFFSFVLVGVAFWGLLSTAILGTLNSIQAEQRSGTLEAILVSSAPPWSVILGGAMLPLLIGVLEMLLYLAGGAYFFNVDWGRAHWPALAALVGLAVAHGAALGFIVAAVVIVIKRGEAVAWVLISVLAMLSGVFYPVEVLPEPLHVISEMLPLTYALRGMREALFVGGSPAVWLYAVVLALSTLLLMLTGAWALKRAIDVARTEGSLAHF